MRENKNFINSFTFQLEMMSRIFYKLTRELFIEGSKNKITLDEYVILETFVLYPHLNKDTLAIVLIRDKSYVEKMLTHLIRKKLIKEIKNNNKDIRVQYYDLTDQGQKIYNEYLPESDKLLGILARFISEKELVAFTKTLLKIKNILISLGYVG